MDRYGIHQKVHRHVIKAIYNSDEPTLENILTYCKRSMLEVKSLVDLPSKVKSSLKFLEEHGVIQKINNRFKLINSYEKTKPNPETPNRDISLSDKINIKRETNLLGNPTCTAFEKEKRLRGGRDIPQRRQEDLITERKPYIAYKCKRIVTYTTGIQVNLDCVGQNENCSCNNDYFLNMNAYIAKRIVTYTSGQQTEEYMFKLSSKPQIMKKGKDVKRNVEGVSNIQNKETINDGSNISLANQEQVNHIGQINPEASNIISETTKKAKSGNDGGTKKYLSCDNDKQSKMTSSILPSGTYDKTKSTTIKSKNKGSNELPILENENNVTPITNDRRFISSFINSFLPTTPSSLENGGSNEVIRILDQKL